MARRVVALGAALGGSGRAAGQRSVAAVGDSASRTGYSREPIRDGASPSYSSRRYLRKTGRAFLSLFSSNIALSYRKDSPHPESAPANNPFGLQSPQPQQPTFDQQLAQILQGLPPAPQPFAPLPPASTSTPKAGTTTAEEAERKASESSSKQTSPNLSALNAADGKYHLIFEGTALETVLLNRLDGQFTGLVECLVTNDIYSHDRQHLLIPSG